MSNEQLAKIISAMIMEYPILNQDQIAEIILFALNENANKSN